MDTKKSIINVSVSILTQVLLIITAIFIRRILVQNIGNDVNGLNSLYSSIIGMLAVAELGVGGAITFSMYKPIVDGDKNKVGALYFLYKKLYIRIGCVIFCAGLVVLPFLPKLISDYETLNINVYIPFFLTLVSAVLSYFYGAKTSLVKAYKNNYITTVILTFAALLRCGLQTITILNWRSYNLFLICQIIETLVIWVLTDLVVRRRYLEIITSHETIDKSTKAEIVQNIKAMFMHKIGTVMVNTVDSLVISAFIGVVVLGKYSNYALIVSVLSSLITLFFSPLTSVVGHLYAAGDVKETMKWFDRLYSWNFILGVVFFLGYYAVIDYVVRLLFGPGLEVSRSITFIITFNQYTAFMRTTALLFRDASGSFYYDRWKPIAEGVVNLALSLVFVNVFPETLRVVGVIAATIITTLCICHIVDPYVVYKHAFHASVKTYYVRNYCYIGLFTATLLGFNNLVLQVRNEVLGILLNGFLSIGVSMLVLFLVAVVDRSFKESVLALNKAVTGWIVARIHDR